MNQQASEYTRMFHRITFPNQLKGSFTIGTREIPIDIVDLSANGISFIFDFDLPLSKHTTFLFSFCFEQEDFSLSGTIIRKFLHNEYDKPLYGVRFTVNEDVESHLVKQINQFQLKLRRFSKE